MTEHDRPSDTRSRTGWRRRLQTSGVLAGTTSPARQSERFALDYATWRAHVAAPGSRFDTTPAASPRIIQIEAALRPTATVDDQRRTA